MAVPWKSTLHLILVTSLLFFDEWLSSPTCRLTPTTAPNENGRDMGGESADELKVMMVADMLLLGSETTLFDSYFRDYYMTKFFREYSILRKHLHELGISEMVDLQKDNATSKSFETLKPDMLIVLGDVSTNGSELTKAKWVSVVDQFERMVGPFLNLPFHVVLGDRDIGDCHGLNKQSVNWIAGNFPGLDSDGCGAFEISNVTFVTLNAVALLCGNNDLRFSVEKVIERESLDFQMEVEDQIEVVDQLREITSEFLWRENSMASGTGPILLLHFPLHRTMSDGCNQCGCSKNIYNSSVKSSDKSITRYFRRFIGAGAYDFLQTIPPNATEYIFQALRPKMIFSAHSHEFCDYTHKDGTREITIPSMSWNTGSDPGFIIATFRKASAPMVSHCSLAKEYHVIIYIILLLLLMLPVLFANSSLLRSLLS